MWISKLRKKLETKNVRRKSASASPPPPLPYDETWGKVYPSDKATRRAVELLDKHVTKFQKEQLWKTGLFKITTPAGRRLHLNPRGKSPQVCIMFLRRDISLIPEPDQLLSVILSIKSGEFDQIFGSGNFDLTT